MKYAKFLLPLLLVVALMIGCAQKPPTVTKVDPAMAPSDGGTEITITGTGFKTAKPPVVTVGGAAATNVKAVSKTSIKASVPAGTAGDAPILVQNAGAKVKSVAFNGFKYYDNVSATMVSPDVSAAPPEGIDAPAKIDISFNQDVTPETVAIKVTADADASEVAGAIAPDAADPKIFSFTPGSALKAGAYTVTISGATSAESQMAMPQDQTFNFTVKEAAKGAKKAK